VLVVVQARAVLLVLVPQIKDTTVARTLQVTPITLAAVVALVVRVVRASTPLKRAALVAQV
jgi:hypothetical protein